MKDTEELTDKIKSCCGYHQNNYIRMALYYLPNEIHDQLDMKIAFISTNRSDAYRMGRKFFSDHEIIVLSERILPKTVTIEDNENGRYFIFCVLHEIAHVYRKHPIPLDCSIKENNDNEKEADVLALTWFNKRVKEKANPNIEPLTMEELLLVQERNQKILEALDKRDY